MKINGRDMKVSSTNEIMLIANENEDVVTRFNMSRCDRVHLGWYRKMTDENPYRWTVTLNFGSKEYGFEFDDEGVAGAFEIVCAVAQRARA